MSKASQVGQTTKTLGKTRKILGKPRKNQEKLGKPRKIQGKPKKILGTTRKTQEKLGKTRKNYRNNCKSNHPELQLANIYITFFEGGFFGKDQETTRKN